jgi:hypothetical protein
VPLTGRIYDSVIRASDSKRRTKPARFYDNMPRRNDKMLVSHLEQRAGPQLGHQVPALAKHGDGRPFDLRRQNCRQRFMQRLSSFSSIDHCLKSLFRASPHSASSGDQATG